MTRFLLTASAASLLGIMPALAQTSPGTSAGVLSTQDRTFVQMAAQGDLAEIQAGTAAEKTAANPAVREFGRWMVTDHTMMHQMMQAVAQREGMQLPTSPNQQQTQEMSQLQSLQGAKFDQAYIAAQVQDHQTDIAAFQQEASSGQDPMLKRLAETSLPMLQAHLTEARELQQTTGSSSVASTQPR